MSNGTMESFSSSSLLLWVPLWVSYLRSCQAQCWILEGTFYHFFGQLTLTFNASHAKAIWACCTKSFQYEKSTSTFFVTTVWVVGNCSQTPLNLHVLFLQSFFISRDLQPAHHIGSYWQNIFPFFRISLELGGPKLVALHWAWTEKCQAEWEREHPVTHWLQLCWCFPGHHLPSHCKGEIHFHSAIHQHLQVLNSRLADLSVMFFLLTFETNSK